VSGQNGEQFAALREERAAAIQTELEDAAAWTWVGSVPVIHPAQLNPSAQSHKTVFC
jgi:hypothetical protein